MGMAVDYSVVRTEARCDVFKFGEKKKTFRVKKLWYIYTMEYYSAIKRNEIESFVETWIDLETVIQSEVSQKEKNKYRILTHVCGT